MTSISNENSSPCNLSWTNITKTVELKDNSTGLIKSTFGEAKATNTGTSNAGALPTPTPTHKIILNQVSGQAKSGEIIALMGPSGSGKTSLLDVISSRSTYQDGQICLNGSSITANSSKLKSLKRKIAYIKQQDVFFDHLSVKDQLTYTAFLRLSDVTYTKAEKVAEVDRVIQLLRLQKCADTPIRLVSGGEKKRVNIGTELLTNPSIIMLDEPTSGLDSTSAVALLDLLVSLAHDHGKTIITSIHQPSSAVFNKFDRVQFLADGCVVFYGTPAESLNYVKQQGYPCPEGYNGSEHWMDLLVEDSAIHEDELMERQSVSDGDNSSFPIKLKNQDEEKSSLVVSSGDGEKHTSTNVNQNDNGGKGFRKFLKKMSTAAPSNETHLLEDTKRKRDEYSNKTTPKARLITAWDVDSFAETIEESNGSDLTTDSEHSTNSQRMMSSSDEHQQPEQVENKFNTTWTTQFHVLLHRALKNSKSKILTPLNIIKSAALGVLTGLLWYQMPNDEKHLNDRASWVFFATTFWVFDGMFGALFAFPTERTIIFKERASGCYHLSAYFLSKTISELPTRMTLPTLFWIIAYWLSNVNSDVSVFFGTLGATLLSVLAGESYGLLCGALVMDFEKALTYMVVISLTTMAAGGFYVENIPNFLIWIKYLSPFKSGYEASQIMVFNRDTVCDGSGSLMEFCKDGVEYATSEQVLKHLGSEGTVLSNLLFSLVLIFVPRYLAFLALKSKKGAERS